MEFVFDLENPLLHSNDNVSKLFQIEADHMPCKTYLQTLNHDDSNLSVRGEIVSLILDLSRNFDPFSSYLAVNYMDRFLSIRTITDWKQWMLKLVAISCISLALKMMKIEFSVSDFQDNGGLILDSAAIERMEMLILGALKWRMRSINPFSFMNFFVSLFDCKGQISTQSLKDRASEIIFKAQNDIKLLEFNPSIISASALLFVVHELFPLQLPCFRNAISSCEYVNKENLLKCYNLVMQEYGSESGNIVSGSSTPPTVLDLQYYSSSTSQSCYETSLTTTAEIRGLKRRKLGDFARNI